MCNGLTPRNALIEVIEQFGPLLVGLLFEPLQELTYALMQHGANIAQVQEHLRKQIVAVTLDEVDQGTPALLSIHLLQHGEPQRTAMNQPAFKQSFRDGL